MTYKYTIYLINQEGTDFYKIGITSKSVSNRISSLQTGCPNPLLLVHEHGTNHGFVMERTLQRAFESKKVINENNSKSEWFELNLNDVKRFIELCKMTEYNLSVIEDSGNPFAFHE